MNSATRWIWAAAAFAATAASVHAAPLSATVYPTGTFPLDVQNVQAAIDRGGTVRLKATNVSGQLTAFDFGPADQGGSGVNLNTDVRILGERVGRNATTIKGGYIPILGFVPVKTTIQGIDFEGPLDSPIVIVSSTGTEIVGNHVRGVVPFMLPFGFSETEGIFVAGSDDPANAITGKVRVADNTIELADGDFANGMQFDDVAADIEVSGNSVTFSRSSGVVQTVGILVFRSHAAANVIRNTVTMGPGDPDAFPSGIFIGGHAEARYLVAGNTVTTHHPNADGIDVVGFSFSGPTQNAVVAANRVVTHSSIPTAGGIVFLGAVQNSLMTANRIEGTSGNAIQILGVDGTLTAESNLALANDISRLASLEGDVFFGPDSVNNVFIGRCNSFQDLGTGNRIFCGRAITQAASRARLATHGRGAALETMHDDMRQARRDALRTRAARP